MESLGAYLKRLREERQMSLEALAKHTKYHISKLKALEEDRHDELPAAPYVKGMLSSIARFLGLDVTEILIRYDEMLREEGPVVAAHQIGLPKIPFYKKKHFLMIFTTSIFLILVVAVFIVFRESKEIEPLGGMKGGEESIPPSDETPVTIDDETGPHTLWLEVSQNSWVKMQKDSDLPISFYLHPGQKRQFEARKVIRFFVNEAKGLKILFDNKTIETEFSGPRTFVFPEKFEAVKEEELLDSEKKKPRKKWFRKKGAPQQEETPVPRVRP